MKASEIERIEKNVVNNLQLLRRIRRKMYTKGFDRVYGNTVSIVADFLVEKRYPERMERKPNSRFLLVETPWIDVCLKSKGFDFLNRFLNESNAPEVYKSMLVEQCISGVGLRSIGISVKFETEYDSNVHEYDYSELTDFIWNLSGMGAAEVLLMLGIAGYGLCRTVVIGLISTLRWDVIAYLLDVRANEFLSFCPPAALASYVIQISAGEIEIDYYRNNHCAMIDVGDIDECYIKGLELVHERFPGELEKACHRLRSIKRLTLREAIREAIKKTVEAATRKAKGLG